jgi:HAD superfamily hydrolase (TIGR01509 family)
MPQTSLFPGVADLLRELRTRKIRSAIVTSVVSNYAHAALRHHRIVCDALIAYHDVRRKKPDPEGCQFAMARLKSSATSVVGVGDLLIDQAAFAAAGIRAFCAGWNPAAEVKGAWTAVLKSPMDLIPFLEESKK